MAARWPGNRAPDIMNYTIPLTGGGLTYDIDVPSTRVSALEVYNEGPDVLYYGDVPQFTSSALLSVLASDYLSTAAVNGSSIITLGKDAPTKLVQGMILDSGGLAACFPANATVHSVSGRKITMSDTASSSDDDVDGYFKCPDLATSTNAIPVQPGETVRFTAGYDNPTANRVIRLMAASGTTCAVRIRKSMA